MQQKFFQAGSEFGRMIESPSVDLPCGVDNELGRASIHFLDKSHAKLIAIPYTS